MINFYIPEQFIPMILSGEYVRYGAIIKNSQNGHIIGHLKEAGNLSSLLSSLPSNPVEAAKFITSNAQLMQIQDTLNSLQLISSIGTAASVLNLGVTVAGFAIVINKLNRIENKVDSLIQNSKEIRAKVEMLNIKHENLLFAEIRTAIEIIKTAEITSDNSRKIELLKQANSSFRKIKNYYEIFIEKNEPFTLSDFSFEDSLAFYQRYFLNIYGIIQTEIMLSDYTVAKSEVHEYSVKTRDLIKCFDPQKVFRSRNDYYKKNISTIVDHSSYMEKSKNESLNSKIFLEETLARIESLVVEIEYLEKKQLSYEEYFSEIKALSDGIVLIPNNYEEEKSEQSR